MEKNRKWGYVFDEKLNMYIPDLPRQRKIAKVLLVLSGISFIAASVQGFFLDKTSYEQISFLIYSIVAIFFFIFICRHKNKYTPYRKKIKINWRSQKNRFI